MIERARVCMCVCSPAYTCGMNEWVSEQTNDRPSSSVSAVCIVSLILLLCFNICFAILLYLDNCDFSVYVILSSVVWLGWFGLLCFGSGLNLFFPSLQYMIIIFLVLHHRIGIHTAALPILWSYNFHLYTFGSFVWKQTLVCKSVDSFFQQITSLSARATT